MPEMHLFDAGKKLLSRTKKRVEWIYPGVETSERRRVEH